MKKIVMKMNRTLSATAVILTLVGSGIAQKDKSLPPALSSLVEAERAFARTSVEKGVRASFIEYFADDGIAFQPDLIRVKETYLKRPAPAMKPPVTLNWQPVYADVAQAGDLGYTTGPYVFTDQSPEKSPTRYGFYFSVWKKQADGTWKVAIDCGIATPDQSHQTFEFKPAPRIQTKNAHASPGLVEQRNALIDLDRQFLRAASSHGTLNAYFRYLGEGARLHRNDVFPVTNKEASQSLLSKVERFTWEPIGADVSSSDDLGYTYGKYDLKLTRTEQSEKGYYVRVWKRDVNDKWKLVLDTLSPMPPEK